MVVGYAISRSMQEIARQLGRAASTISRELRRNAATRSNGVEYRATTAQWHAERSARRPKQAKLALNAALRTYHPLPKWGHDQLLCETNSATWRLRIVSQLSRQARGAADGCRKRGPCDGNAVVKITRIPRSGLVQHPLCCIPFSNGVSDLVPTIAEARVVIRRRDEGYSHRDDRRVDVRRTKGSGGAGWFAKG
jgi:hypothetical protein